MIPTIHVHIFLYPDYPLKKIEVLLFYKARGHQLILSTKKINWVLQNLLVILRHIILKAPIALAMSFVIITPSIHCQATTNIMTIVICNTTHTTCSLESSLPLLGSCIPSQVVSTGTTATESLTNTSVNSYIQTTDTLFSTMSQALSTRGGLLGAELGRNLTELDPGYANMVACELNGGNAYLTYGDVTGVQSLNYTSIQALFDTTARYINKEVVLQLQDIHTTACVVG